MKDLIECRIIPSVNAIVIPTALPFPITEYTLHGSLRLVLSKSIKLQSADIFLLSEASVLMMDDETRTYKEFKRTAVVGECVVCGRFSLNPGTNNLDFKLPLAIRELHSSVEAKYGSVRYKLMANVLPSSMFAMPIGTELPIAVEQPITITAGSGPNAKFEGKREGKILYEFEVPKVVPFGQLHMPVMMKLIPMDYEGWVKTITIEVEEVTKYRVPRSDPDHPDTLIQSIQWEHVRTLSDPLIISTERNPETFWNKQLNVPVRLSSQASPFPDNRSPIIGITHRIHVHMIFFIEGEKKLAIKLPVMILTQPPIEIPSTRTLTPPPTITSARALQHRGSIASIATSTAASTATSTASSTASSSQAPSSQAPSSSQVGDATPRQQSIETSYVPQKPDAVKEEESDKPHAYDDTEPVAIPAGPLPISDQLVRRPHAHDDDDPVVEPRSRPLSGSLLPHGHQRRMSSMSISSVRSSSSATSDRSSSHRSSLPAIPHPFGSPSMSHASTAPDSPTGSLPPSHGDSIHLLPILQEATPPPSRHGSFMSNLSRADQGRPNLPRGMSAPPSRQNSIGSSVSIGSTGSGPAAFATYQYQAIHGSSPSPSISHQMMAAYSPSPGQIPAGYPSPQLRSAHPLSRSPPTPIVVGPKIPYNNEIVLQPLDERPSPQILAPSQAADYFPPQPPQPPPHGEPPLPPMHGRQPSHIWQAHQPAEQQQQQQQQGVGASPRVQHMIIPNPWSGRKKRDE